MKTIIISGSDTGIGKTFIASKLAKELSIQGFVVEYLKLLETGVEKDEPGDLDYVKKENPSITCKRLFHFEAPIAPVSAAKKENKTLPLSEIINAFHLLYENNAADFLLIEGPGGLGVPLDSAGFGISEFAQLIKANYLLLVVENKLGAIHQVHMACSYAKKYNIPCSLILNEIHSCPDLVNQSNHEEIKSLNYSISAEWLHNSTSILWHEKPFIP